jgi:hypothetical protein
MLGLCSKPVTHEIDLHKVVDDLIKAKPDKIKDNHFVDNMYEEIAKS